MFGTKGRTEFSSNGTQIADHLESNVEKELMTGFAEDVTLSDKLNANVKPLAMDAKNHPALTVKVSTDGKTGVVQTEGKDYTYTLAADGRISVRLTSPLKGSQTVTGDMGKQNVTALAGSGQTVAANDDKNTDYAFQAWNTRADGKGTAYKPSSKLTLPDGTTTLYAQWKQIPANIHYDSNGGTGNTPDTNGGQGDHTTLTPNGYSKECWLFDSWNTKKDGTGTKYTDKQAVTLKGDITLYAQWKRDPVCKAVLVYDKNAPEATGATKGYTGWKGDTTAVAKNGFENEGYTFDGWNTSKDGKGTAYKQGDKIVLPAGTTTLYAQWNEIPGTLSWAKTDKETGKVLAGSEWDLTDKQGQTVHVTDNGELDQAEGEGAFKLTGLKWGEYTLTETKAPAGHDKLTEPISLTIDAQHTTVSLGDVTNSRTPATVHYDPNGGQGHMDDHKGFVGDTPEAGDNKFTNKDECKEFAGWNTQADGKGKTYQSKDQVDPLTSDITLYAQWKTKDNCPAAKPGELGHTGSSVLPYAFSAVLLVLRRQRHGQHA